MKIRMFFFWVLFLAGAVAHSQYTEKSIVFSSGFFHVYTEKPIEPFYTMINVYSLSNPSLHPSYVNQPWGSQSGFSFTFGYERKRIQKNKLIWGYNLGFESLQSKKSIHWINDVSSSGYVPANGTATLRNNYLNLFPYFGYRLLNDELKLDLLAGVDLAGSFFSPIVKANATVNSTNQAISVSTASKDYAGGAPVDFRWRFQIYLGYRNFGFHTGYSIGLFNQEGETVTTHSYARYFRIGASYRLK